MRSWYDGLIRCPSCGFATVAEEVSRQELESLYSGKYFMGDIYANYLEEKASLQSNFRLRLKPLQLLLGDTTSKKLLEIGCAYGFFLEFAKEQFRSVQGIDISRDAIRYAVETLGMPAVTAEFSESSFRDAPFDVICFWDTIEHVPHPDAYLEKASSLLSAGGVVAITTGDVESLNARIRGRSWRMIQPPFHLHYFSRRSLGRLLERKGLRLEHVEYAGYYRSLGLILRNMQPRLYQRMGTNFLSRLGIYLNLFDILYVIARKVS
jgi:2-polyprenyl-3-methyl-5-hydroxy-6-metoxy-1,4-benzoquinol methylase